MSEIAERSDDMKRAGTYLFNCAALLSLVLSITSASLSYYSYRRDTYDTLAWLFQEMRLNLRRGEAVAVHVSRTDRPFNLLPKYFHESRLPPSRGVYFLPV